MVRAIGSGEAGNVRLAGMITILSSGRPAHKSRNVRRPYKSDLFILDRAKYRCRGRERPGGIEGCERRRRVD